MQAVILCGGLGTRIAPVARGLPKSLLPVAERPFIEHQLERLRAGGVGEVLLCVGAGGDRIEAHVGDGTRWGLRVEYSREDPRHLLGTGGALVNALPLLAAEFLAMYGDSFLPIDVGVVAAAFRQSGCPALMSVYRNAGRWDASNARVEGGRVTFYSKTAASGGTEWIDYGLMGFRRSVIEAYRDAPMPLDLAVVLAALAAEGRLAAWVAPERFYEIGKPDGYWELDALMRAGRFTIR